MDTLYFALNLWHFGLRTCLFSENEIVPHFSTLQCTCLLAKLMLMSVPSFRKLARILRQELVGNRITARWMA